MADVRPVYRSGCSATAPSAIWCTARRWRRRVLWRSVTSTATARKTSMCSSPTTCSTRRTRTSCCSTTDPEPAFSTLAVPQATFGNGDAVWPIDYDNNGLTDFVVANGAERWQGGADRADRVLPERRRARRRSPSERIWRPATRAYRSPATVPASGPRPAASASVAAGPPLLVSRDAGAARRATATACGRRCRRTGAMSRSIRGRTVWSPRTTI